MYLPPKTKMVKTVIMGEGLMDTEVQVGKYETWVDFVEMCLFKVELPTAINTEGKDENLTSIQLEKKASQLANEKSQGSILKYGQQVQLRHLHSNSLLTLNLHRAGIEPGTFKVTLEQKMKTTITTITLLPENKLQKIGEQIKYADRVIIMFQDGGLKYFMQLHAPSGTQLMEINGSHNSSAWIFSLYADHDTDAGTVACSFPVRIQLVNSSLHLSERVAAKDSQACLLSDVNDFRGLWLVERSQMFQGGSLHYEEQFFLKNAQSGRYLTPGLTLQKDIPEVNYSLRLPKPDAFKSTSNVAFNFPLIFSYRNGGKLAAKSSERKEEIMSQLVPYSFLSESQDLKLEGEVITEHSDLGKEVLFEFSALDRKEGIFFMQVAKLVPKIVSFSEELQQLIDEHAPVDEENESEMYLEHGSRVRQVIDKLKTAIVTSANSELVEMRQNTIVGLNLHTELIVLACKIAGFRQKAPTSPFKSMLKQMFTEIWQFLIEVAADNLFSCRGIELSKDAICKMVKLEEKLIGSLLNEVYRLIDPDMPNYEEDFTVWCNRLKTLKESNIEKQAVFIKLIRSLCEVGEDVKLEYQRVILNCLFRPGSFQIFKLEMREDNYFIHFCKKDPAETQSFQDRHPRLKVDQQLLEETGEEYVNMSSFRRKPEYVNYVCSALYLVNALCRGFFEEGRIVARLYLGMTPELIFGMMVDLSLHIKIREVCLMLTESIVLSIPPNVSTLERKERDQCYVVSDLQELAPYPPEFADPVDSAHLQSAETRICLRETLSLWTQMEIPIQIKGYDLSDMLDYLIASLKIAYSLLDHEKCSQLYITCLTRTMVYLLIGLSTAQDAPRYSKRHWAVYALKNIELEAARKMEIRLRKNELFRLLVTLLNAICAHIRQEKCLQLLRVCISDVTWEKDSAKLMNVLLEVKDPMRDVSMIKRMMDRAVSFVSKYADETDEVMETIETRPASSRSLLLHAPVVKDYFFRAVLSNKSIANGLKDSVIKLLKSLFNEEVRIGKFMNNVDMIADPELIKSYKSLCELKTKVHISDLAADCRLEMKSSGEARSLVTLCDALEMVINFINPRKKMSKIRLTKTQNILRHLLFHRQFMGLWQLCLRSPKTSAENMARWERLRALLTIFLLNFCRSNERNSKELKNLFSPNYYFLTIPQFPELIREVSNFDTLNNDSAARLVSYILSNHDEEFRAFHFVRIIMFDAAGNPKDDIQNIAARLISEKLFTMVSSLKPDLAAVLIELQALACYHNPYSIVQSRNIISLRDLKVLSHSSSPALHYSILMFLHYVYMKKVGCALPTQQTPIALDILTNTVKIAEDIMERTMDLIDAGKMGLFELVFAKDNPSLVDEMIALQPLNPLRVSLRLLYYVGSGEPKGGLLEFFPRILLSLTANRELGIPVAQDFIEKLIQYKDKIRSMEESNPELDFSGLETVVVRCIEKIDEYLSLFDLSIDLDAVLEKTDPASVASRHKGVVHGTCQEVLLEEKLNDFTLFYEEHLSSTDNEEYIKGLVANYLFLSFKGEFPQGKVPKETITRMVSLLERVKHLFTGTRSRRLYFKFLRYLVPDVEKKADLRKKYVFNQVFLKAGVVEEAVDALIKNNAVFAANSTLEFLNKLLEEQTKAFQDTFQDLLASGERAYYLFSRFKNEIANMKQQMQEEAAAAARKPPSGISTQVTVTTEFDNEEIEVVTTREKYVINLMVFLQLCCDNCNIDFQNYIRSQSKQTGLADIDMVSELAMFVIDLGSISIYVTSTKAAGKMLSKAIAALLDFVTGPCPGNQLVLGTNVQLLLAINKLLKAVQVDLAPVRRTIHAKIILFLHTLLEGAPNPQVCRTMLNFMDLADMRSGVESVFQSYIEGREEAFSLESVESEVMDKVKTTILQAIFLMKLQDYSENHPELKKFGEQSAAYRYCVQYIGYVEVEKLGVIQAHYFPIPFKCKYLTTASRVALLMEVNRNSHQKKVEDFMSRVPVLMREMAHQQLLSRSKSLKSVLARWALYARLSFAIVFIINLQLLFTFSGTVEESVSNHPANIVTMVTLGTVQLLLYMVSFLFYMLEYLPNKVISHLLPRGIEIVRYPRLPHNESQYLKIVYQDMNTAVPNEESFESSVRVIFNNMDFYYAYFYFLISITAIYFPLIYPVLMLDLIKQNQELVNVLKAITVNARQLVITLCLGMIIIFLFSVYAFVYFQQYYSLENGLECRDLLNCFMSTLHMGVRAGGGIGDCLIAAEHEGEDYWQRMAFDMLFYLIIIIILLNIIFGIIIDTFALLRSQREAILLDINTTCYCCGLDRSEIERRGRGWTYHFMVEHSPLAYLSFLVYLIEMPIVDCSGIEKYVKEKFDRRDVTFMPTSSKLIRLAEAKVENEAD